MNFLTDVDLILPPCALFPPSVYGAFGKFPLPVYATISSFKIDLKEAPVPGTLE